MSDLRAVTVDLDDTLFAQSDWLAGAWIAVASGAVPCGLAAVPLHEALLACAAEGSDRGGIIDRALALVGVSPLRALELTPGLVEAFSGWAPAALSLYPGAAEGLVRLRSAGLGLAVITDGNPRIQRSKIAALGLADLVDHVVISDELGGRASRKPHPAAFRRALELLRVGADEAVHIGDRPAKDVAGAAAAGMRAVRVRTGEYAHVTDDSIDVQPWRSVATLAEAADRLLGSAMTPPSMLLCQHGGRRTEGPVA
jgi:putative hydrolase of the HAD superfamily